MRRMAFPKQLEIVSPYAYFSRFFINRHPSMVTLLPSRLELPGSVPALPSPARFYQRCIRCDLCGLGTARHPTMHFNSPSDSSSDCKKRERQRADLQVRAQHDSLFLCSDWAFVPRLTCCSPSGGPGPRRWAGSCVSWRWGSCWG